MNEELEKRLREIIQEELEEPMSILKSILNTIEIEFGKKLIFCHYCDCVHDICWDRSNSRSVEAKVGHSSDNRYCGWFSAAYGSSTAEAYQQLEKNLEDLYLREKPSKNGERK